MRDFVPFRVADKAERERKRTGDSSAASSVSRQRPDRGGLSREQVQGVCDEDGEGAGSSNTMAGVSTRGRGSGSEHFRIAWFREGSR